jgi:hypothetical protein
MRLAMVVETVVPPHIHKTTLHELFGGFMAACVAL